MRKDLNQDLKHLNVQGLKRGGWPVKINRGQNYKSNIEQHKTSINPIIMGLRWNNILEVCRSL